MYGFEEQNPQYIITKISEIFPGLEHIYAKLHEHYLTCLQFFYQLK